MTVRIDYAKTSPDGLMAMLGLERHVRKSELEADLLELVRLRASQMNGCAYCIDMHTKDARVAGETEQRLHGVVAWRETPYYTDRERAALAWAEEVTGIGDGGVSDETFTSVREHFSEEELVDLTLAVVAINGWNRLAVALGAPVGSYEPGAVAQALAG